MITMSKVGSAVGGQGHRSVYISGVQQHDIILAACSYHDGGNPHLVSILNGSSNNVRLIGKLETTVKHNADVVLKAWEANVDGKLNIQISSFEMQNLDLYSVVFRPSQPAQNVNAYLRTKVSDARAWTDPITVYAGEWILCGQYSSYSDRVVATPSASDKKGTAAVSVEAWALPEGATGVSNSFFEVLHVTSTGTFQYMGPNPSVMRLTIQGDPVYVSSVFGSMVLI